MTEPAFVDASVIVALLAKEAGWERLAATLRSRSQRFTSPVAMMETVMVLSSASGRSPGEVETSVRAFLASQRIGIVAIDEATASEAVQAFARYGKGRNPARLNLGGCFAYACAKQHRLALLYKGGDFARTDLA